MTAMMTPGAVEPSPRKAIGRRAKKYVKVAPTLPPMADPNPIAQMKLTTVTTKMEFLRSSRSTPSAARA